MTDQDNHWRWATPEGLTGPVRRAEVAGGGAGQGGSGSAGAVVSGGAGADGGPRRLERWRDALVDRLPATLRGRWSLDRTTAIVLVVSVLLAALVLGGWAWLRATPHELSVARTHPVAQGGAAGGAAGATGALGVTGSGSGLAPQLSDQGSAGPMPDVPPPRALPPPQQVPAPLPQIDASPLPGVGAGGFGGVPAPGAPGIPAGPGVVVDVEGKVARPGVQTLPVGSRVIDAIAAAGGALPGTDLTSLNQAEVLVDGQQVLVGIAPPPGTGEGPPGRSGGKGRLRGSPATPVRLNSATLADLEQLPGVGPALAQRILDYRTEHGPFRSVEDLQAVSGFGGARFQTIEPLITL